MVARVKGGVIPKENIDITVDPTFPSPTLPTLEIPSTNLHDKYTLAMEITGAKDKYILKTLSGGSVYMLEKGSNKGLGFEEDGVIEKWMVGGPGFHRCIWEESDELMERMIKSLPRLGY